MKPIHIAGTKGKGSTSAFVSSILEHYVDSSPSSSGILRKIGLYTSPHIRYVRERIQINNEPLSEILFARYFFETWDRLEESAKVRGRSVDNTIQPTYFRFLTLMAFHAFMSEGVSTAVIECGIGGEYDSTNFIESPSCTGITSLGIDHTPILGDTIEEIAWHKAGIMKADARAFSAPQPRSALKVLHERADAVPTPLTVVAQHPALENVELGLAGDFQKTNASLAIALASCHLQSLGYRQETSSSVLPDQFIQGLEKTRLQGRCDVRLEGKLTWFLDFAHTLESIDFAAKWFASQIRPHIPSTKGEAKPTRILFFNQQTRDANKLVRALHESLHSALDTPEQAFTHAVFCTNLTSAADGYKPDMQSINVVAEAVEKLEVQKGLAETWEQIDPQAEVMVKRSIEEAVNWCRQISGQCDGEVKILVTGSSHLVGGVLDVLESS